MKISWRVVLQRYFDKSMNTSEHFISSNGLSGQSVREDVVASDASNVFNGNQKAGV